MADRSLCVCECILLSDKLCYNRRMAKKKSRKRKKRIRMRSFFLPFIITLTAVAAAGVFALAAHSWITEPVRKQSTDSVNGEREKDDTTQKKHLPNIRASWKILIILRRITSMSGNRSCPGRRPLLLQGMSSLMIITRLPDRCVQTAIFPRACRLM